MGSDWTARDQQAFAQRGWSVEEAETQAVHLQGSGPTVAVDRPCTAGDGIHVLTAGEREIARTLGTKVLADGALCARFVPASGAASRMFAALRNTLGKKEKQLLQGQAQDFPFWSACQREALQALSPSDRAEQAKAWMLDPESGWSHLPKGLIPFHRYPDDQSRSSFEEHAKEWNLLAGHAPLHFTVPERYQDQIEGLLEGENVQVSTSVQAPSTDTLAWDMRSRALARHADGSLLFRPGGHGALLKNLASITSPFIFVRNIDNIVPTRLMAARNEEQKVLLGRCASLVKARNALLSRPDLGETSWHQDAVNWLAAFQGDAAQLTHADSLIERLDRPIRVAGMVRNEGAPGGGPFWIRQANGRMVPSIVESAELPEGRLDGGTHFNPVDMVCNVQRADGSRYDVLHFSDEHRYFIGQKDWNGQGIRILERPGLWNGGMDEWLTQFVEVPATTFAPVKSVFDLLDPIRRG
jgi:hypothetical protein